MKKVADPPTTRFFWKRYWVILLWAASVPLYLWASTNPDRYVIDVRGEASPNTLAHFALYFALTSGEAAVLMSILRPKSYHHSWKRSGLALMLFSPWLLVSFVLLMHATVQAFVHFLWLLLTLLAVAGLTVHSAFRTFYKEPPASAE